MVALVGSSGAQDSRRSGIVYAMSWPLTLYSIFSSVPG